MLTVTKMFEMHNESGIQDTVYVLRFPEFGIDLSTHPVLGLSTQVLLMDRLPRPSTSMNPLAATASVSSITASILDIDRAFTALRRQYGTFENTAAEVYEGYRDIDWSEYVPILSGRATGLKLSADMLLWGIEINDPWDQTDMEVFKAEDLAAEPYSGDKSFDGGSLIIKDSDGDSVYDTVVLTGNPVTLMHNMLISTGANVGGYDVWPVWAGMGMDPDLIDIDWNEAEQAKVMTVDMRFTYREAVNVRKFIQDEVCRALGGYPIPDGTGRIRIRYPSRPVSSSSLQSIADSDILSSAKPQWSDPNDLLVTEVIFQLGHDGDAFTAEIQRSSPQFLAGKYKQPRTHKIISRGLQLDLGGMSIADAVIDQIFARYGDPPARVKFSTTYQKRLSQPGDALRLSTVFYPDVDGLGEGAERLLEALSVKGNINKTDFDCVDLTGPLSLGARAAVIAPNGQPNYTSASAAQRAYAYLADEATSQLSNGDTAYYWS
jgi:hypothetical protein